MGGIEGKIEGEFIERLELVDYCLERADEEVYAWESIKRELTAAYNYLTLESQNKYQQRYKFQLNLIDMVKEEQRKRKCA